MVAEGTRQFQVFYPESERRSQEVAKKVYNLRKISLVLIFLVKNKAARGIGVKLTMCLSNEAKVIFFFFGSVRNFKFRCISRVAGWLRNLLCKKQPM